MSRLSEVKVLSVYVHSESETHHMNAIRDQWLISFIVPVDVTQIKEGPMFNLVAKRHVNQTDGLFYTVTNEDAVVFWSVFIGG